MKLKVTHKKFSDTPQKASLASSELEAGKKDQQSHFHFGAGGGTRTLQVPYRTACRTHPRMDRVRHTCPFKSPTKASFSSAGGGTRTHTPYGTRF